MTTQDIQDMMSKQAEYGSWLTAQFVASEVVNLMGDDILYVKEKLNLVTIRYDHIKTHLCDIIKLSNIEDIEQIIQLMSTGLEVEFNKETARIVKQIEVMEEALMIYKSSNPST